MAPKLATHKKDIENMVDAKLNPMEERMVKMEIAIANHQENTSVVSGVRTTPFGRTRTYCLAGEIPVLRNSCHASSFAQRRHLDLVQTPLHHFQWLGITSFHVPFEATPQ